MGLNVEQEQRLSSLMRKAQEGDKLAYRSLLEECVSLIRPFARSRVGNVEHAEDVVQETLHSIHRARHTYDPEKAFAPWLYAIAAHRIADFLRKSIRISQHEVVDDQAVAAATGEPSTLKSDLEEEASLAVLELPEKQRTVVELLKLQEMPVREVAKQLGMSESAVKVTAFRAYEKLRKRFGVKNRAD